MTRCDKCGKVADKYVEYELLLVLMDTVLHRKPAIRHLLYNRMSDSSVQKSIRWVPFVTVAVSCALKVSALGDSAYKNLTLRALLHVVGVSISDQIILIALAAAVLYLTPSATAVLLKQNRVLIKLYLSLASAELIRGFAIILQIFDGESGVLLLVGLLILSIQFLCFQCLTNIRTVKLVLCAALVVASRMAVRYAMFSSSDMWKLGFIM